MRRCPKCRRDYYDDSLSYCLDDGAVLVDGPGSDESDTAIFPEQHSTSEEATRTFEAEGYKTDGSTASKTRPLYIWGPVAAMIAIAAIGAYYLYLGRGSNRQISSIVLSFRPK